VQLLAGALATLGTSVVLIWAAEKVNSDPLVIGGVIAGPGVGGLAVCALGRLSTTYDGDCLATILSSYLGSVVLAIPAGIFGYYALAPSSSDGSDFRPFGALYGAVFGVVVGAAVGATIGWHSSKHRRDQAPAKTLVPIPPRTPTVVPYDWSDLRPRTPTRTPTATFTVPLLTLRF
jgi:outer membrane lipoprotein SlyB